MTTTAYHLDGNLATVPAGVTPSPRGIYEWVNLEACRRCGGAGGWKGWPGFVCYECGGERKASYRARAYTAEYLARFQEREARKAAREQAAFDRALAKFAEAFGLTFDQAVQTAEFVGGDRAADIVASVFRTFDKAGPSERQSAAVAAILARPAEFGPESVPTRPTLATLAAGRHTLAGKFVSTRLVESQFGVALKGLFIAEVDGAEAKVWMTVPAAAPNVGEAVTLAVTVEPGSEPGFHYGKRPKVVG